MSKAYYNEFEPYAAQWLRNLIAEGHIAPGDVDERSIEDVTPKDLHGYTQCHFFAGIGVWSRALRKSGWTDDRPVWTGSCPCQPFSAAGKGGGFSDERHLWPAFHHLIRVCRPPIVIGEQVASKDGLSWLDLVSSDMGGEGYAFGAVDTCAAGVGAPHIRQRLYWVADTAVHGHLAAQESPHVRRVEQFARWEEGQGECLKPTTACSAVPWGLERSCANPTNGFWRDADWLLCRDGKWRAVEPGTFPLANGAPARVGRLRAYGNAIVAPQAKAFIEAVMDCIP